MSSGPTSTMMGKSGTMLPANYSYKTDALGFRWDLQSFGGFNNGTNSCYSGSAIMNVNGRQFSASSATTIAYCRPLE